MADRVENLYLNLWSARVEMSNYISMLYLLQTNCFV